MGGERAGEHREGLLAAVLLIGRDQHDVQAGAGAFAALIGQPEEAVGDRVRLH